MCNIYSNRRQLAERQGWTFWSIINYCTKYLEKMMGLWTISRMARIELLEHHCCLYERNKIRIAIKLNRRGGVAYYHRFFYKKSRIDNRIEGNRLHFSGKAVWPSAIILQKRWNECWDWNKSIVWQGWSCQSINNLYIRRMNWGLGM